MHLVTMVEGVVYQLDGFEGSIESANKNSRQNSR